MIRTERLLLRPWAVQDAASQRQLWAERDPRVPAHRRLTPGGRPTVSDLKRWIRSDAHVPAPGLLAVEHAGSGTFLGYCGLVANTVGRPDEPELAYELLRASWRSGYATEAAAAVVERARAIGYPSLASTVREWNTASLRVLEKLGFVDTLEREPDAEHGDSLLLRKTL